MFSGLTNRLMKLFRFGRQVESHVPATTPGAAPERLPSVHVILLDGTLGDLTPGHETNVGRMYRLLRAAPHRQRISLYYEAGVQWQGWRDTPQVAMGRGINRQIRRVYGWLASRYRPGDRIYLFGYSRGAYAVRSLAGVIDRVGLLMASAATERNVRYAYRYYSEPGRDAGRAAFAARFCHPRTEIEMIGVFDTVKALGVRLPILWRWSEPNHEFHNHALSPLVRHGYQALALDETREAFAPVLWDTQDGDWAGRVEQVWFRGAHGDVGGMLSGYEAARPLANVPLVWMLDHAEACGLPLPPDWRETCPTDPDAPSVGTWRHWGKLFLIRHRRHPGADPSELLHPTAIASRGGRAWLRRPPHARTDRSSDGSAYTGGARSRTI